MGYELYREVLRDTPAEVGTPARLLLAVLADRAGERTRECWPGMGELCHLTGLGPDAVRKALRQLADHGLDPRVPIGKDRKGKLVFAAHGHRTQYRIPKQSRRALPSEGVTIVLPSGEGVTNVRASASEGVTNVPRRRDERPPKAGRSSPPSPQEPSENTSSSAEARVKALADLGATAEEEKKIVEKILNTNSDIENMPAYLAALGRAGDLRQFLDSVRADAARLHVRTVIDAAKLRPSCEHGQPGGAELHPTSQEPLCPLCRADLRRATRQTP